MVVSCIYIYIKQTNKTPVNFSSTPTPMEVFQMMWNVAFSLKQKITQWRSPDWSCMILSQSLMMVDHHQLLKESSSSFPQRTVRHTKYMCEWIKKQLLFGFLLNTPKTHNCYVVVRFPSCTPWGSPNIYIYIRNCTLTNAFCWAVQVGLLTPLTFAWRRLSPLAAFTSGAYFLLNGRWWQWICKFYTANFKGISGGP